MISFWERESFTKADFIIVGAGITGLSAALSLREKHPNSEILVLERGIFPTGASTKNAGFACFGSLTEICADKQTMTQDALLSLIKSRKLGLSKLVERLGSSTIDYQQNGGYELISKKELPTLSQMDDINKMLLPLFGEKVFEMANEKIKDFGFDEFKTEALILNPFEGQVDTGKMMKALIGRAYSESIIILTGAEVTELEQQSNGVVVVVKGTHGDIFFRASKTLICTNAFTKKLLPNTVLSPGRGQVLVTKPIQNLPFKGTFHFDEGYYYFRNFNNRVIFGGGRNIDFETETTHQIATTSLIQHDLKHKLEEVILPNIPFEVEHTWAGIMAFGKNKQPIIEKSSQDVVVAARLGGMGVAIGTLVGERGAALIDN